MNANNPIDLDIARHEQDRDINSGKEPLAWQETRYGPDASVYLAHIQDLNSLGQTLISLDDANLDTNLSAVLFASTIAADRLEACLTSKPADMEGES